MNRYAWVIAAALILSLTGVACGQVMTTSNQTMDNQTMDNQTQMSNQTMGNQTMANQTMGNQTQMGENVTPSINVTSPVMVTGNATFGNLTIDNVTSDGPGWVVIHNNLFGTLGGIVGVAHVESGMNSNVTVPIDTSAATDQLIADLHKDLGQRGAFDGMRIDVLQMADGQPVTANFSATGQGFMLKNLTQLAANQTMNQTQNMTGNQTLNQTQNMTGNLTMNQTQNMTGNQTMGNQTMNQAEMAWEQMY
jgi:hypothetical protein